jgi:hypothetical protein
LETSTRVAKRLLNFRKGWKRSKQGGAPPVMFVGIPIIVTIDIRHLVYIEIGMGLVLDIPIYHNP